MIIKDFHIFENNHLGSAELSQINPSLFSELISCPDKNLWVFFNRLFVNENIRNRKVATRLMQQVVEWATDNKINIIIEVNPYGDLDFDQLVRFYKKFDFEQVNTNVMIRRIKN